MAGATFQILSFCGSLRPGSLTRKAMTVLVKDLEEMGVKVRELVVDQESLPFPGTVQDTGVSDELQARVAAADGMVIATPEYQGSYSAWTKLVIEHLGYPSVLENKPVALLGVAAGGIGAVKSLEHLRGVLAHIGVHVLPFALSVGGSFKAFDENGEIRDPKLREQFRTQARSFVTFLGRHKAG